MCVGWEGTAVHIYTVFICPFLAERKTRVRGLCLEEAKKKIRKKREKIPKLEQLIDGRWLFESSLLSLVCSVAAPALLRLNYL